MADVMERVIDSAHFDRDGLLYFGPIVKASRRSSRLRQFCRSAE